MCRRPLSLPEIHVPRVLIIDDEQGIRFALQRWFARQGWSVLEAADGRDGLTLVRASGDDDDSRLDLIVCDLHLPRLSGEELYGHVKRERPEMIDRLIFSTGDAVDAAAPDTLLATHARVLQKPFELATLRDMIATMRPET